MTRFHSPSLASENREATTELLTKLFGFEIAGHEGDRTRLTVSRESTNAQVDLVDYPGNRPGRVLAGTVHHIAFRAKDQEEQEHWRSKLYEAGLHVTPIIDRQYFHSVYFREPGGILFEIATDGPGFAIDEPEDQLGENLRLPPQYRRQPQRNRRFAPPDFSSAYVAVTEFIHLFVKGWSPNSRTLLLLHGTGGDENDLLPLGKAIDPSASLLSLRGRVLENGAPRFFRRLAEGVFDEEDVLKRSRELAEFLESAIQKYSINTDELILVGYSNGANIASSMILLGIAPFSRAILLRAMVPLTNSPSIEKRPRSVLILEGERDSIAPPAQGEELANRLRATGAEVELRFQPSGHELPAEDIVTAQLWLG